ncbi:MAG: hypothetical protein ABIR67_03480 [Gaiellaceae bacterium]
MAASSNLTVPHFAALYARREEERLAAVLAAQARDLQEQIPRAPRPVQGRSAPKLG